MDWSSPSDPHETLQHLKKHQNLHSLDVSFLDMGDVEAKLIGKAVAAQQSLAKLTVMLDSELSEEKKSSPTSMWPMDSFLMEVFLKTDRESSVRVLVIAGSDTDGLMMRLGILPEVLYDTEGIRELLFRNSGYDGYSREEMHKLLGVLRTSSIESLALPNLGRWDFPNDEDNGFIDADNFAQVVELVRHNVSIHKLQLHIGECRGPRKSGDVINLDGFYRALSSNSSIRSLCLKGPFCTPMAKTAFSNWIRKTSTLQELQLQSDRDESPVPKLLFQALRGNKSLRKLELEDFAIEGEDVDELLASLKVNKTLRVIVFHPECDRMEDVREALKRNLRQ